MLRVDCSSTRAISRPSGSTATRSKAGCVRHDVYHSLPCPCTCPHALPSPNGWGRQRGSGHIARGQRNNVQHGSTPHPLGLRASHGVARCTMHQPHPPPSPDELSPPSYTHTPPRHPHTASSRVAAVRTHTCGCMHGVRPAINLAGQPVVGVLKRDIVGHNNMRDSGRSDTEGRGASGVCGTARADRSRASVRGTPAGLRRAWLKQQNPARHAIPSALPTAARKHAREPQPHASAAHAGKSRTTARTHTQQSSSNPPPYHTARRQRPAGCGERHPRGARYAQRQPLCSAGQGHSRQPGRSRHHATATTAVWIGHHPPRPTSPARAQGPRQAAALSAPNPHDNAACSPREEPQVLLLLLYLLLGRNHKATAPRCRPTVTTTITAVLHCIVLRCTVRCGTT